MLSLGLFYLSLGIYCLFMWLRKWIFMIGFPVLAFISLCLCCKVKRIALSWMTEHCDFLLQTVDVFAIVALSGILSRLLSTGTVLVATSNRAPSDLNQVCLKQNLPDRIDLLKASIHNFVPFWWFYLDSATPFGFLVLFFQDGMQKEIFQQFLAKLDQHCENILVGSEIDYRRHIAKSSIDQARTYKV